MEKVTVGLRSRLRGGRRGPGPVLFEGLESRLLMTTAAAFYEPVSYVTGEQSFAVVDMNGDGRSDIVAWDGKSVSVLMNRGNGTFASPVRYAAKGTVYGLTHGDLDGDGREDLAVAQSSDVSVFLNSGGGKLAARVDYHVGTYGRTPGASEIVAADIDKDGKLDLAVGNMADTALDLFLNHGDGTFASKVVLHNALNTPLYALNAADMNGDGWTDLVAVTLYGDPTTAGRIRVMLNDTHGGFTVSNYALGTTVSSVTLADIDGDGDQDVIGATVGVDLLTVMRNNGDGTLAAREDYWEPNINHLTTGDLNGDGKVDLAMTVGMGGLTVRLNDGSGRFGASKRLQVAWAVPVLVAAADFNGDGAVDLATNLIMTRKISVMLNRNRPGMETTVNLWRSKRFAGYGEALALCARVTTEDRGVATGWVRFLLDGKFLGVAKVKNGMATLRVPMRLAGRHQLTAVYDGDGKYTGSSSAEAPVGVQPAPWANLHRPVGIVTRLTIHEVVGWVYDADAPMTPVPVQLVIDGKIRDTQVAWQADVLWRYAAAEHGFYFSPPPLIGGQHLLEVYFLDPLTGMRHLAMRKWLAGE